MKKFIEGHVVQEWDEETKQFVSQEFIMEDGDAVHYEDEDGEEYSSIFDETLKKAFLPHDMVQPENPTGEIKKWIRTGDLDDDDDLPMTVKGLLEDAGAALDSAYSHEIMGEILFEGADGKVYVGTVEFCIGEANPNYVKMILEDDE